MFNCAGTAYATLAEAVAACASGGEITVDEGSYTTGYATTINKPLTLRGLGATPADTVFTASTATMLTVITNAVELNRIASGDGALIEGPSVQWFPTSDQFVRTRGKNSVTKDNRYVA